MTKVHPSFHFSITHIHSIFPHTKHDTSTTTSSFFSLKPNTILSLEFYFLLLQTENHLPYNSIFFLPQTEHYIIFILTYVERWSVKVWHAVSLSRENNHWSCIQFHLPLTYLVGVAFKFKVVVLISSASLYTVDDSKYTILSTFLAKWSMTSLVRVPTWSSTFLFVGNLDQNLHSHLKRLYSRFYNS